MKSNDRGKRTVGVKIQEAHAIFQLSFVGYERITNVSSPYHDKLTTNEREMRFNNDQLTERVMIREMGQGNRDIELVFGNPIIVT